MASVRSAGHTPIIFGPSITDRFDKDYFVKGPIGALFIVVVNTNQPGNDAPVILASSALSLFLVNLRKGPIILLSGEPSVDF